MVGSWLVGWLVDWLVGWLVVGWLVVGWLGGCVVGCHDVSGDCKVLRHGNWVGRVGSSS